MKGIKGIGLLVVAGSLLVSLVGCSGGGGGGATASPKPATTGTPAPAATGTPAK